MKNGENLEINGTFVSHFFFDYVEQQLRCATLIVSKGN